MKRFALLVLSLLSVPGLSQAPESAARVLFVGNSLTYRTRNRHPQIEPLFSA